MHKVGDYVIQDGENPEETAIYQIDSVEADPPIGGGPHISFVKVMDERESDREYWGLTACSPADVMVQVPDALVLRRAESGEILLSPEAAEERMRIASAEKDTD